MPAVTPIEWEAPLDPSEVKEYTHSFAPELAVTQDIITSSLFILPADAIAAGLQIESQLMTSFGGLVWFSVAPANQNDPGFNDSGTRFRIRHQIETFEGRTLERSIMLTVKHL